MSALIEPVVRFCAFLVLLACIWAFTNQWYPTPESVEEIGCIVILLLLPLALGYSHFRSPMTSKARHLGTVSTNSQVGAVATHKSTSLIEIIATNKREIVMESVEEETMNSSLLHPGIEKVLPDGWEITWSDAHERHYYFSHATGETTWEEPAAKASDHDVVVTASLDGTITHRGPGDHQHKFMLEAEANGLSAVAYSTENMAVVTGGFGGSARVWNAATGKCEHVFDNSGGVVCSVVLSACGKFLLTGLDNHSAQLWHLHPSGNTGALVPRSVWTGHTSTVASVAFSPCSIWAATGSWDGTARIFNVASGACEHVLQGHAGEVFAVTFSPCSKLLASASQDGTARLWNVGAGRCIMTLDGHDKAVRSVAFSPCGVSVATGCWDGSMKLWDAQGGTCQMTFPSCAKVGPILSLAFSAAGSTIVTGHVNAVRLWSTKSGVCCKVLEGYNDVVKSVAIIAMPALTCTVSNSPRSNITMSALLMPFGRFSALMGLLLCIWAVLDRWYPNIESLEEPGCGVMLLLLVLASGFLRRFGTLEARHLTTRPSHTQTGTTTAHKAAMLANPQFGTTTTKKAAAFSVG